MVINLQSGTKGCKPEEEEGEMKQMSLNKCRAGDKYMNSYKQHFGWCMWVMFGLVVTVEFFLAVNA